MEKYTKTIITKNCPIGHYTEINPSGANAVVINVDQAGVTAGVTINGAPAIVGANIFECPTPYGTITQQFTVYVPAYRIAVSYQLHMINF